MNIDFETASFTSIQVWLFRSCRVASEFKDFEDIQGKDPYARADVM